MKDCPICKEKQARVNALLKGTKKLQKVILGLMITLIITAFLGDKGIMVIVDFVKGIVN